MKKSAIEIHLEGITVSGLYDFKATVFAVFASAIGANGQVLLGIDAQCGEDGFAVKCGDKIWRRNAEHAIALYTNLLTEKITE